jgi:hypothetical protein
MIAVVGVLLLWLWRGDEVGVVRPEGWRRWWYWKKKNERSVYEKEVICVWGVR